MFLGSLNQLAISTVLAREVNTALGTEHALVSLPTPSPVTPSSCNQSPFMDPPPSLDTPPPSQPLAFLESKATFPGLWGFPPREAAKNVFREFPVTKLLHRWFTKEGNCGERKVKDSRMGKHRCQVPQRPELYKKNIWNGHYTDIQAGNKGGVGRVQRFCYKRTSILVLNSRS